MPGSTDRAVRTLLLAAAAFATAAPTSAQSLVRPVAAEAPVEAARNHSESEADVAMTATLDRAADLLAESKPLVARATLAAIAGPDAAAILTEAEQRRLDGLMRRAVNAAEALSPVRRRLQTAELALYRADLVTAERQAQAVLASPDAEATDRGHAEAILDLARNRRTQIARAADQTLASARANFAAGHYAEAQAGMRTLAQSGIELDPETESEIDATLAQLDELQRTGAAGFETASLGAFQPGVVAGAQPPATTQPVVLPFGAQATGSQPARLPGTGGQPAAQPTNQPATQPPAAQPQTNVEGLLRIEAQRKLAEGDQAFQDRRLIDARQNYETLLQAQFRRFLTADQIATVEERLAEVRLDLRGGGDGQDLLEQQTRERRIQRQQVEAEFENSVTEARRALRTGDFDRAQSLAAAARITVQRRRELFGEPAYNALIDRADSLDNEIAGEREKDRIRRAANAEDEATRNSNQTAARLRRERSSKINELLGRVRDLQAEQNYDRALQEIDQILFLDPNNLSAQILREIILDTRLWVRGRDAISERRRNVAIQNIDNLEATNPPPSIIEYPDDWRAISFLRGDPLQFAEAESNKQVLSTLRNQRIPVQFSGNAFEDVLTFMSSVGNFDMDVDWESLSEIGVEPRDTVSLNLTNVSLETALQRVLDKVSDPDLPASWAIYDGVLTVASDEVLRRNTILEIYDIQDLLIEIPDFNNAPQFDLNSIFQQGGQGGGGGGQSPFQQQQIQFNTVDREELTNQLIDIIQTNVDPNGWQALGGDTGAIQQYAGNLIITNTARNHRQVFSLLNKLRTVRNLQINVESRFLLVSESYFEQFGIDLDVFFGGNQDEFRGLLANDPQLQLSDLFDPVTGQFNPNDFATSDTVQVFDAMGMPVGVLNQPVPNPSGFSPIGAQQNSFGLVNTFLGASSSDFVSAIAASPAALSVGGQFLNDIQVDFLVTATQADNRSLSLTAPRLTFTNGQTANVFVATQQSFIADQQPVVSTGAVGFDPQVQVVSEGVILEVQGVVTADRRYVTLNVRTAIGEVDFGSEVEVSATAGGGGNTTVLSDGTTITPVFPVATAAIQIPIVTITSVSTTVTVPDQGTILLGGQRLVDEVELETGVPVLSKIPILNRFFSNRAETKEERTLLILLKPTILIQNEEEERAFPGLLDALSGS